MAQQRSRKKQPTQADVARRAGVSQATVSYVLNNNTVIAVPPETRQRIQDAIRDLGYIPDRAARSLRTRKTYTLAGVIPDITNPFYPAFERGIQDLADQQGYDLIMYNTDGSAEKEHKSLRSVQQGRVDGLIAVLFHLTAQDLLPLLDMNIAVVRLEATPKQPGAARGRVPDRQESPPYRHDHRAARPWRKPGAGLSARAGRARPAAR